MALTSGRTLNQKGTPAAPHMTLLAPLPVKATVQLYTGGITLWEISSGSLVKALTVANAQSLYRFAGICAKDALGGAANGDTKVEIQRGVFILRNAAGADALVAADLFADVFAVDDEFAANNSAASTRVKIGQFLGFSEDGSGDVIVACGLGL